MQTLQSTETCYVRIETQRMSNHPCEGGEHVPSEEKKGLIGWMIILNPYKRYFILVLVPHGPLTLFQR